MKNLLLGFCIFFISKLCCEVSLAACPSCGPDPNPCREGSPLIGEDGKRVICHPIRNLTCAYGYYCLAKLCCPIPGFDETTTTEPTTSTYITCETLAPCGDFGVILYEFGCPRCRYLTRCPYFGCSSSQYCFRHNVILGTCIPHPCIGGKPHEGNGVTTVCNDGQCPVGYNCQTAYKLDNVVNLCCPENSTTTSTSPKTPHCDPNFECHGGVIMSDTDGCPICVYHDTCIDVGCPPGEYCLVLNETKVRPKIEATCVSNPCMINEPLEDQSGAVIICNLGNGQYCESGYTCTPIPEVDNTQGVCCIGPTTTSTTTCTACDEGCFHENWSGSGGCGPCICGDTCVELPYCPSNEFCLSTKGISRLFGTCVNNPCHHTRPHEINGETTICDNISKHCPEYHNCFVVAEDVEGRSVCCEFNEETTTPIP